MSKLLRGLIDDTSGATAVEYGLMVALIAIAVVGIVTILGENIRDVLYDQPELNNALGAGS